MTSSKQRIKRLQQFLIASHVDALLIDNPTNLFYLTELELSAGNLLISQNKAHLFVDSRYFEACKNQCALPVSLLQEGALEKALVTKNFGAIVILGFDSDATSYNKTLELRKLARRVASSRNNDLKISLRPLESPVKMLRAVKDDEEISILKRAASLGSEGFDYVCNLLKAGITEVEVATELEIFWKRRGSKGLAFESIIAFGANSSMPHYKPGNVKLKKGDPVLIDIGVNLRHYHSDMTRVPFFGKPSKKMQEIYTIVLEAQEEALKLCTPGTKISDLDAAARAVIADHGYAKNFTHSLGHGIGLDVHELPFIRGNSKTILEPGMVITIEPGIYLSGIGGVRIEDTVVITETSHENLTNRPKSPLILPYQ